MTWESRLKPEAEKGPSRAPEGKGTGLSPKALKTILYQVARQGGARSRTTVIGAWPSWEDIEKLEACWARNVRRRLGPGKPLRGLATVAHTSAGWTEITLVTAPT